MKEMTNAFIQFLAETGGIVFALLIVVVLTCYPQLRDLCRYFNLRINRRLEFGELKHPELQNPNHAECVMCFQVINRSEEIAYIKSIKAMSQDKSEIAIKYSSEIDHLGNPSESEQFIGIRSISKIFVRQNSGEPIYYMRLKVKHTFSVCSKRITYDISNLFQ